ncbi:MAG: FAD-binding oxidoreductase, partial [Kordiimonadaceae bacterium]|nr:FAD-binding oxidoreductase [Kordiimonadaceae bacterium]
QPDGPAADRLQRSVDILKDTGYPLKNLSRQEFGAIAGEFSPENIGVAAFSDLDGHLDPVSVTHKLIARAKALGSELKMPCSVEGLIMNGDQLKGVKTNTGDVALDRLVIAAGVDTPDLTSKVGYETKLIHAPGILAHTSPVKFTTKKVVYSPGAHFKQFADGRIVGADSEEPPETLSHKLIKEKAINFPSKAIEDMHTQRIIDVIATKFPAAKDATPNRLTLGFRPKPVDGMPIIGYIPGSSSIYSAVMHSGITLAPIVGQLVAKEIIGDSREGVLTPYRPERFV